MKSSWFCRCLLFAFALAAGTPAAAAWPSNPMIGHVIADTEYAQVEPAMVGNGWGGTYIFWDDVGEYDHDIRGQQLDPYGHEMWPAGGVTVCDTTGSQSYLRAVADGDIGA